MRILSAGVAAIVVLLGLSNQAGAEGSVDPKPPPTVPPPGSVSDGEISTEVGSGGSGPGPSPTKSGGTGDDDDERRCTFARWNVTKVENGITYILYSEDCLEPGGERFRTEHWFADIDPGAVAAATWDRDKAKIPKPSLGLSPPLSSLIVRFDTWLWTDPASFAPVSVSSSVQTINGPLSATVTAEPLRLVFDPGEPGSAPVVCVGPGQPWLPIYGDDAESACMYSYRHSSEIEPSGTFTARWSTVWRVTWTSSNGGGGVLADEYLTTTEMALTVKEVQVLVTD